MKTKILFLDVDGVLNKIGTKERSPNGTYVVEERLVDLLHDIVVTTDCDICLSSTWRNRPEVLPYLYEKLGPELSKRIVGQTPKSFNRPRGHEIQWWLDEHPEVNKFVILDDRNDMGRLLPHLVQTDDHTGLTEETANQVKTRLLN